MKSSKTAVGRKILFWLLLVIAVLLLGIYLYFFGITLRFFMVSILWTLLLWFIGGCSHRVLSLKKAVILSILVFILTSIIFYISYY